MLIPQTVPSAGVEVQSGAKEIVTGASSPGIQWRRRTGESGMCDARTWFPGGNNMARFYVGRMSVLALAAGLAACGPPQQLTDPSSGGSSSAVSGLESASAEKTEAGSLSREVGLRVVLPTPGEEVITPALSLNVYARHFKLDARYAGTPNSSRIGHYHEILDGNLVDMTPLHGPNFDTVSMVGVAPGSHVLTLVPVNNDHSPVMPAAVDTLFTYAGPYLPLPDAVQYPSPAAVTITSPPAGATVAGPSFNMSVSVTNFNICGDCFGKANLDGVGHWHIFLDQPMMANMLTMAGGPTQEVSLKAVPPGWHTFWAVLVNDQHMPYMGASSTMTSVNLYVPSEEDDRSGNDEQSER